jgi:hypothetical protein
MPATTVNQKRAKVVNDAADALSEARESARSAANKLADLTGHEPTIAKARDLASQIEDLITTMAGREVLIEAELEQNRRAAREAAKQNARDQKRFERLDDSPSDYVDARDDV